ncbi:MAG: hypothetical protein NVS4B11_24350 [Ktedonobacteraceae bacterium]
MPTWEETKRASQTAFISPEIDLQAAPDSISNLYQELLSKGHISPSRGEESLTRQIAEGTIDSPETPQPEISRSVEQEQDIEPER